MPSSAPALATSLLLLLAGCGGSPEPPCRAPIEGLEVVQNTGPGQWARQGRTPSLRLLWRRGGTNAGEHLAFPAGVAMSEGGRLAVVDFELAELVVIEPDGRWRSGLAGRGPGPGELEAPVAAAWVSEDTVVVFDVGASELEFIGEGGARSEAIPSSFTGPVVASGQLAWAAVDSNGTTYLETAAAVAADRPGEHHTILRLERGGAADTLVQRIVPMAADDSDPAVDPAASGGPVAAVSRSGVFFSDGSGDLGVTVADVRGRPVRYICRPARPDGSHGGVERLVAAVDGSLWVQGERADPADRDAAFYGASGASHDVFDSAGHYLGRVRLPDGVRLQAVRGDTLWGFRRGDLDEVWVEAYEVELAP